MNASRDALAQLYWYRHCYYPEPRDVRLLALFNEPVGDLCLEVLKENGIDAVWPDRAGWNGTAGAVAAGMCN